MAKILYAPGIEEVSGALSKINTKSFHRDDQNMLLATHRKAESMSLSCSRAYYRKVNSLPWQKGATPSAHVLEIRGKFEGAAKAISVRRKDLMSISTDQQEFLTLNAQLTTKATLDLYYWCAAKKYMEGTTVTFPSGALGVTKQELAAAVSANRSRQKRV